MSDVLLVSMPFGPLFSPSLALSLLKAALAARGFPADVRYFSLDFAEAIGQGLYSDIGTEGKPPLTMLAGEWIFSGGLFDSGEGDEEAYVREVLQRLMPAAARSSAPTCSDSRARRLLAVRAMSAAFIDACLAEVVDRRPKILGLTSIFQQHVASLALAKRVKTSLPETVIVMGGANCEGIMGAETARQFPFVDAVVSGEGEIVLPEIVARVLSGRDFADLPGVRTPAAVEREFREGRFSNAGTVAHMDHLPHPDFKDFFQQFEASPFSRQWEATLFYETSRGCWWGERQHCTFCGLNGSSMAFRSKSAGRAISELEQLAREHPKCDIQVVDNILDMSYFDDLLPLLAERELGVDLFYETKSNLKKAQIRQLRKAGIRRIQPGVESFSDSVLKLMRKGVSGIQNIQLLKWCKELGVEPQWNFLWGFPGEDPEEYLKLARLVPSLTHLPAPAGFSDIRLDRFSPNFFDAQKLGFAKVRPLPAYAHVYPGLEEAARGNLAYFFGFDYQEPRDVGSYVGPLVKALRIWGKAAKRGDADLFSVDLDDRLLVFDLRPGARKLLLVLDALDRALLRASDAATDGRGVAAALSAGGLAAASEEIRGRLARLVSRGLAVEHGLRHLSLTLPLGEYVPGPAVVSRLERVVREIAEPLGPRSRGRHFCETLRASDFTLDDSGDLVIQGTFRIRMGTREQWEDGQGQKDKRRGRLGARKGRPMEACEWL